LNFKSFTSICFSTIFGLCIPKVFGQCNAGFKFQSNICKGSTIQFSAKDTTKGRKYVWDFGDPFSGILNSDSIKNPSHLFNDSGHFKVKLIVKDTNCTDTQFFTVIVFAKPKVSFTWSNGCANLGTKYKSTLIKGPGDSISKTIWDLGNGSTSAAANPTKTYTATGTYKVKLRVFTKGGCADSVSQTVVIYKKPTNSRSPGVLCKNGQANFIADTIYNAIAYNWDFGDTSSFTQRTVSHIYKSAGIKKPFLKVDFATSSCVVPVDSIVIRSLPDPQFSLPKDTFCYNGNNVCVKFKKLKPNIKSRTIVFDDGFIDDFSPLSDTIICHNYNDTLGGKYAITVELIDTSGCVASITKKDAILVHRLVKAKFQYNTGNGCFKTGVLITNTSNQTPPLIQKYKWSFGDGVFDSSNWNNVKHTYTANGSFNVKLNIQDQWGCSDSFVGTQAVKNTSYSVDAKLDTLQGYCRNSNIAFFKQTNISGATIQWNFGNGKTSPVFNSAISYQNPGIFKPWVLISKNGCDSITLLDTVLIHGPQAAFSNVQNRYQCQIKDTVFMTNSSWLFYNKSAQVFWDAGDGFANNCVLDTRAGNNLGNNCRYSQDSLSFKHMYQKGKENCYSIKLLVKDTILGCSDSVYLPVALMAPIAKGLFSPSNLKPCPGPGNGKAITFDINLPQPSCVKYAWWVMWDSLQATKSGNFDSLWLLNSRQKNYDYKNYAGDSLGNVTIGLIVENGLDSNGQVCRDTGWFHHLLKVTQISPNFTSNYNAANQYCPNSKFSFFLKDSNQNSGTKFIWDYGDGSTVTTQSQGYNSHVFKNSGSYKVKLSVRDSLGCFVDSSILLTIGFSSGFKVSTALICVGDTVRITDQNRYYYWNYPFWSDAKRIAAGKEKVYYNLDDGLGYQNIGPNPAFVFHTPGTRKISMIAIDSTGCVDTLKNVYNIDASGIYAGIKVPFDTVLCAQNLKINSLATTIDSASGNKLGSDIITAWEYAFGNGYSNSYLPNPTRYFATNLYKIRQVVVNNHGCRDTAYKTMRVKGPTANYNIISDSIGCAPLAIKFKNNSKDAVTFIWKLGDVTNATFIANSDTNIQFKYNGYGTFNPYLVARGAFTINGITRVCDDIFPDTSTAAKIAVVVWELPKPNFTWSTNCATGTSTFVSTTAINTGSVISVYWSFGDGSTSNALNPTHKYADTGTYRIVIYATSNHGCTDSFVRNIVVSPVPVPNFGFTQTCIGTNTFFTDSSTAYNDRIYKWLWNFGDGAFSNLKNPTKLYLKDTVFDVNLMVTNIAGCVANVTKKITIFSKPVPKFAFTNVCDKNPIAFSNSSTSKQALIEWKWSFGDGFTSTKYIDSHQYTGPGNYWVKLKLKTTYGCQDSVQKSATIYPNPIANFILPSLAQCQKYNKFLFRDSSKIKTGTTTAQWKLGNGDTAMRKSFNYHYPNYGTFNIKLVSISNFNCKDSLTIDINVNPNPKVNFGISSAIQCFNYNRFGFSDSGKISSGNYTYTWQFGDGVSSSVANPSHHYVDTGKFKPLLILTSGLGCSDSLYKNVYVNPMPTNAFTVNDSDQCLNANVFNFTNQSKISGRKLSYSWSFGDGNTSVAVDAVNTYLNFGTFKVLLAAKSSDGCIDTVQHSIEVYPMPKANFTFADSAQCLKQNNYTFINKTAVSKGTLSYFWNFGDKTTSTGINPNHIYSNFGPYSINLISTSSYGCIDSILKNVTVHPMPFVQALLNKPGQCINAQTFIFKDTSRIATGSLLRKWNFGDSTFSNAMNLSKTYNYPGNRRIWLSEISDKNCTDSVFIDISVFPKPYPKFLISDSTQCLRGNQFTFANLSKISNGSVKYLWDFGDAKTDTLPNPKHKYGNFGNFRVRLKATSNNACFDTSTVVITIYPMPVAKFSVNDSDQCLTQNNFIFSNLSGIVNGSLSYAWKFGDLKTSALVSPNHAYLNHGSFAATLIATSMFSCADTISKSEIVFPMPIVSFNINDTAQCLNKQLFVLKDSSKIFSGSLMRKWVFADSISNRNPIQRKFNVDIFHAIKLIETSNNGCIDSLIRMVIVHSVPIPKFSLNDTDQCVRQNNFIFKNNSTINKGNIGYNWNFGDGNLSDSINPKYKYIAYGIYKALLTATSDKGCLDTTSLILKADPMPQVSFTINDTGQCINNQLFVYTNISNIGTGSLSHFWNFGDNSTSLILSPIKQYGYDTNYQVKLVETSNKGCKDSASAAVDVYPKPQLKFIVDDSIQCLRQNIFIWNNISKIKYGYLRYSWSFGDTKTDTNKNTSHVYTAFGNFPVVLASVSNLGCIDSAFSAVVVGAMPGPKFSVNDEGQCFKTQNFVFTDLGNIASGSYNLNWKFGDGVTSAIKNTTHNYSNFGNYKLLQILTSNYGCIDSAEKEVRVFPNSNASFSTNDSDQCANQQNFIFTNTSTVAAGKIQSINWDLNNGKYSNLQSLGAYYKKSGFYRIKLVTITDSGCLDSITNPIRVYPKPAAWFNVNDSAQCLFQNYYAFTDLSFDSVGVNKYNWNINSESAQFTKLANYKFASFGFKSITLISTSLRGCSDTIKRVVYVKPMPDPVFEKLKSHYCEFTGPIGFTTNTLGGNFSGKNILGNQYFPLKLWLDTIKYIVTVNGCKDSSKQLTQVYPGPKVDLGGDSTLCLYEMLNINLTSWQSAYVWDNGSIFPQRRIAKPGKYFVTVTNICGSKSDTFDVNYRGVNCRFYIPTVFTPNHDGLNENFKPVTFDILEMTYSIFNRWGEKVFEGKNGDSGWDGIYMGDIAQSGAYIVNVSYRYDAGYKQIRETAQASFQLLR